MNYLTRRSEGMYPLADFRPEMDQIFDDFFVAPYRMSEGRAEGTWAPSVDIDETDEHYLLTIEVPGVPKADIKIEAVGDCVTISGVRRHVEEARGAYAERRYGPFERSFTLPAGIEADKIEASYQDGLLYLVVPKAELAKTKQIKIESGSGLFQKLLGSSKHEEKKERVA